MRRVLTSPNHALNGLYHALSWLFPVFIHDKVNANPKQDSPKDADECFQNGASSWFSGLNLGIPGLLGGNLVGKGQLFIIVLQLWIVRVLRVRVANKLVVITLFSSYLLAQFFNVKVVIVSHTRASNKNQANKQAMTTANA